eukprot:scaffold666458_cov67-Attheya_sp.AAC.1
MSFVDVGTAKVFLGLQKRGEYMLIRPFYELLYQQVAEMWLLDGENRVLVQGNAGTGKSWFQLYALRRLLQGYGDAHEYLFVIRQVGTILYLIDLADAQVRELEVDNKHAYGCLNLFNDKR